MQALPRTKSCFVCGESNPLGLRLAFAHEQWRVSTRFQFRPEHVGFKQTIHGGLIATVLDEAMVWACGVGAGQFAYSAEMTVRYLKPVRPNEPLWQ